MQTSLALRVATATIVLCALTLHADDKYVLDLTLPTAIVPHPESSFGCGPRLSSGDHGELSLPITPLALEIVNFGKRAYAAGEDLISQIRLVNVGKESIRIPWNPNSDYGNKDCAAGAKDITRASLTASFALVFTGDDGSKRNVPLENLYGRLSTPDTFQVLHPGEAATVKFRERLGLPIVPPDQPLGRRLDLPQDFTVTATYSLDDTSLGNPYVTVNSRNQVKLTVERAPTQQN